MLQTTMQRDQFEHQHAANTIEMRGSNSTTFLLKPLKRQHSSSKCCKQQGEHTKRKKNMVEENLIFPQIASKCFTSWNSQETQENQGSVTFPGTTWKDGGSKRWSCTSSRCWHVLNNETDQTDFRCCKVLDKHLCIRCNMMQHDATRCNNCCCWSSSRRVVSASFRCQKHQKASPNIRKPAAQGGMDFPTGASANSNLAFVKGWVMLSDASVFCRHPWV